jgi:hypothetical protein
MPKLLYPPSRPQSVGEVLDTGFRIYSTTLLKCLPYSFASVITGQLLSVYNLVHGYPLVQTATQKMQQMKDGTWWLLLLILIVVGGTLGNSLFLRQHALASGQGADMRAELKRGAQRMPGTVLIWILMVLAVVATLIPCMIAAGALVGLSRVRSPAMGILFGVVCALAASWVVIRFVCSNPAYLLSERSPMESLGHSWHLTGGNFWRLSAIYTVGVIILIVFYVLTSIIGGIVALLLAHGDLTVVMAVSSAIVALLAALFTPFYYALVLAVYGDLSVRREGSDLAQRLAVPAAQ